MYMLITLLNTTGYDDIGLWLRINPRYIHPLQTVHVI